MIDLNTIKIVLFDFDDTLAIWNTHKCGVDDADYIRRVIEYGTLIWQECSINEQMKEFMEMCKEKHIRMGLISKTCTVLHMLEKQKWVKENYGIDVENFCVSEMPYKIEMLRGIASAYGYLDKEVAIIDDYFEHTSNAANAGFSAFTPMEVVNFVNSVNNKQLDKE